MRCPLCGDDRGRELPSSHTHNGASEERPQGRTISAAFKAEVRALDLVHLPLKLADRGEVGKSKVHIGLEASQKIARKIHL